MCCSTGIVVRRPAGLIHQTRFLVSNCRRGKSKSWKASFLLIVGDLSVRRQRQRLPRGHARGMQGARPVKAGLVEPELVGQARQVITFALSICK